MTAKKKSKPFVAACIPALNEENTIAAVVIQTMKYVDRVLVCDDGSADLTGAIAERLGAVVMRHDRNRGKGATLNTLFNHVRDLKPDIVVILDADGQHNPEEIPQLVEPIADGVADMVVGSRYVEGSMITAPYYRRLGLRLINALSGGSGNSGVGDTQSGFRAYSTKALDVVLECVEKGYGVETEQLALAQQKGLKVIEVPVTIQYGDLGNTSKKNPLSHGVELLGTILRLVIEERPLLFLGIPGIFIMLVGIITGVYFLWLFNKTRYFSIPFALITLGTFVMGTLLLIASILLYAMTRLMPLKKGEN